MKKVMILLTVLFVLSSGPVGCKGGHQQTNGTHRMKVVTTLFPLFDFANKVGGGKADVILLLPPGVEPHDFEPKPKDLATIQEADIFVYTGSAMEPWVQTILKGIDPKNLTVVDASRGITLRPPENEDLEGHGEKSHGSAMQPGQRPSLGETPTASPAEGVTRAPLNGDPHIWLNFANAQIMVGNILEGFIKKDPKNHDFYATNAQAYNGQLHQLDEEYRKGLTDCKTRFFLYGGHYAFNYLARRYNLTYLSVHGISPNAEPSPSHLIEMINKMKQYHLKYIFYEELASPRVAETIANETGAGLLPLNAAHNATKDQMQRSVTFIDIMEEDLAMLRKGLQCR